RLGFLVAVAGLTGWLTVLALVWAVYGKGDTGPEPTWKVQTVVSGTLGLTARPPLDRFPGGWKKLASDSPARGEAEAVVDAELTKGPSAQTLGFSSTTDYVPLVGYEKGGQKYEFFRHRPHYAVIQVQGAVAQQAQRFPVRFYLVAMIFIIFDIEIIFIYPWAVVYRRLGGFGLLEMILFAVAVFVAFVYLISHGALDWGPVSARRPVGASPWVRTTETTIRRVGRGGEHGGEDAAA